MTEPFHTMLGVPPSESELAWQRENPSEPQTAEQIAEGQRVVAEWLQREVAKITATGSDLAVAVETETVEVESDGEEKRYTFTPRMKMTIEWVKPEAVPA